GVVIPTPPGTALLRLADLLGLHSGGDVDRVRALVATAALDGGDGGAACDILSAAILRRLPRAARGRGQRGGGVGGVAGGRGVAAGTALAFTPELCEALDLVVAWGSGGGGGASPEEPSEGTIAAGPAARTARLCAQALSRCPASQIGRLLGPWSRLEAFRFASGTGTPRGTENAGGPGDGDGVGGGASAGERGGGGSAAVASVLAEGGMDGRAAMAVGRTLFEDGRDDDEGGGGGGLSPSRWLDRRLNDGDEDGGDLFGWARGEGGLRTAEGALRLLLLREHGLPTPPSRGPGASVDAWGAAAVGDDFGDAGMKATDRLCILLALAELRSDEATAVAPGAPARDRRALGNADSSETGGAGVRGTAMQGHGLVGRGHEAAEGFGIGPVARAVGYALAATDGRAALGALRALLEQAEGRVKALRKAAGGGGEGTGERPDGAGGDEVSF
ncbi:unnamed protein product, partial [Hapterophycus canaliculatus]